MSEVQDRLDVVFVCLDSVTYALYSRLPDADRNERR
jgi:hypothetical protein